MYIYLKTHKKTGLKYLGITNQEDPHKYRGSGLYWLRHLKEHGNQVDTLILLKSEDQSDIERTAAFFSKLWDVEKSEDFANLVPEDGKNNPMLGRKHKPESIELMKKRRSGKPISETHKNCISKKLKGRQKSSEWKSKISGKNNYQYDETIYNFCNTDGSVFIGTRTDFRTSFCLHHSSVADLFKGRVRSLKGWSLT